MLSAATDNTRIDFTLPSDNALRRIIVDPDIKPVGVWLGNKHIEQVATYIKSAKAEHAFVTPSNLTTTHQCSTSIGISDIWSNFTFTHVGDARNQASLGEASRSGSESAEKLDPLPVSHYMTETESHFIEQWAGHVVEAADPNETIPDMPISGEEQNRFGRTRRVKVAEDDEDEEDDEPSTPVQLPFATPRTINDALNLHFNAQKAKVGRTRIKKTDKDEEEDEEQDESQDKAPVNNSEAHDTWTYPPAAKSTGFGYSHMQSNKKPGRQRVVKEDSDDEDEDNDSDRPLRVKEHISPVDKASMNPVGTNLDSPDNTSDTSNGWNVTIAPEISHG
jgi:hypothetical protein